ncbi:hypothetical protein AX15_003732 [Amanita polypyramis BW_CC]|nr:hypothetical protein AX15_003732 [Amanita polypyramis BW_CC]
MNRTYDPIHADAIKPNNVRLHTIYKSANGVLQLVSVTPFWAVALKMVRYTKSDLGDICLILRNGTNLSGTRWTMELVEKWLTDNCSSMGYASYDQLRWSQFRSRIEHVVTIVNAHDDEPQPTNTEGTTQEGRRERRSGKKTRKARGDPSRAIVHSTPAAPSPTTIQPPTSMPTPTSIPPFATPSWQQQQIPQYYPSYVYPPNAYPYTYYPFQQQQLEQPYQATPTHLPLSPSLPLQATEPSLPAPGSSTTPSRNPRSLSEWMVLPATHPSQGTITRRNTDGIDRSRQADPMPDANLGGRAQTWPSVGGPNIADMGIRLGPSLSVSEEKSDDEEKRRKIMMEWLEANGDRTGGRTRKSEVPTATVATAATLNYIQPSMRRYNHEIQGHRQPPSRTSVIPPLPPTSPATSVAVPPPIVSPTPGISIRSPTPEPVGSTTPSSTSAVESPVTPPLAQSYIPPPPHSLPQQQQPQLQPQGQSQEDDASPPVIPSSSLLTTSNPRCSAQHRARYGPYGRDGPLRYHRDSGSFYGDEDGEEDESDEEDSEDGGTHDTDTGRPQRVNDAAEGARRSRSSANAQSYDPQGSSTMATTSAVNGGTSPYVSPVPPPQHSSIPRFYANLSNQYAPSLPIQMSEASGGAQPQPTYTDATATHAESQEPQPRTWTGRGGIRELAELVSGMQIQPASSPSMQPQPPPPAPTSSFQSQHPQLHPNSWISTLQTPSASRAVTRAATPSEVFVPPFYDSQTGHGSSTDRSNTLDDDDDDESDSESGSSNMDHNSLLSFPPTSAQIPLLPAYPTTGFYSHSTHLAYPPLVPTSVQQQQQQQQQQQHPWAISAWTN